MPYQYKKMFFALAVVVLLTVGVYAPSLWNGFCFDDANQITTNPWVRSFSHIEDVFTNNVAGFDRGYATSYYRPLHYVLDMVLFHFFGLSAWPYHLVNVLLHVGSTVLVFLLVRVLIAVSTEGDKLIWAPFAAAVVFGLHPLHTEVVMWASALPDVGYSFFYLCSLFLYMRSSEGKGSFLLLVMATLLYMVAVLFKEPAITLPLVIVLYDLIDKGKLRMGRYAGFIFVTAFYMGLRWHALKGIAPSVRFSELGGLQVFYNSVALFPQYLGKLVRPDDLTIFHEFHPILRLNTTVVLSLLALIFCVAGIAFFAWRRYRLLGISLGIFLFPLLPALYLPALGEAPFAERYAYLPSVGFAFVAAFCVFLFVRNKTVALALLPIIVIYSVGVVQRTGAWKDDVALWSDALKYAPNSATCHRYLADSLAEKGRLDDAVGEYRKSVALKADASTYNNLGTVLEKKGEVHSALWYYMYAIGLKQNFHQAYTNLGGAFLEIGQVEEARKVCDIAVELASFSGKAHECRGLVFVRQGDLDQAVEELKVAVSLQPENVNFVRNLDLAYRLKLEFSK